MQECLFYGTFAPWAAAEFICTDVYIKRYVRLFGQQKRLFEYVLIYKYTAYVAVYRFSWNTASPYINHCRFTRLLIFTKCIYIIFYKENVLAVICICVFVNLCKFLCELFFYNEIFLKNYPYVLISALRQIAVNTGHGIYCGYHFFSAVHSAEDNFCIIIWLHLVFAQ